MAVTARRLDSRHSSQYPEAHGPSVPRARLDASWWRWAASIPSQAERPASQPAGPGTPTQRFSACPGRPPDPQRRWPSPHAQPSILHRATTSARVPIPTQARASDTGAAALANTSVPRSLVTQAHRPSVPQPHRPSVPQARGPSVTPPPPAWQPASKPAAPGVPGRAGPSRPMPIARLSHFGKQRDRTGLLRSASG